MLARGEVMTENVVPDLMRDCESLSVLVMA
jgi:hypothetical protein